MSTCFDCMGYEDARKGVELCPLHAAAPALLEAGRDMLKAADELLTEYVSKKRAANWGVINQAMVDVSAAIAQAKGGQ